MKYWKRRYKNTLVYRENNTNGFKKKQKQKNVSKATEVELV